MKGGQMSKYFNVMVITLFFILGLLSLTFSQEQLTITTYYPSPYGVYNELRLYPHSPVTTSCDSSQEGLMYYDSNTHNLYVCRYDGTTYAWESGGSYWAASGNDIYNTNTGNVGIGTGSPGWLLHVNGDAAKPGGGPWTDSSDIRLKKNIKPLKGVLEKILKLRSVTFEWKEPKEHGNLTGIQMGMIGQEVEKVFPQWVGTDKNGYKSITFRGFEALTVEAIRELKAENDALKQRIEALESKLRQ